jgi:hypothetical protein
LIRDDPLALSLSRQSVLEQAESVEKQMLFDCLARDDLGLDTLLSRDVVQGIFDIDRKCHCD